MFDVDTQICNYAEIVDNCARGERVPECTDELRDNSVCREQQQADTLLSQAMEAVTEPGASTETSTSASGSSTSGSSSSASTSTTGLSTIRPRGVPRPQHRAAEQDSSLFRIDV